MCICEFAFFTANYIRKKQHDVFSTYVCSWSSLQKKRPSHVHLPGNKPGCESPAFQAPHSRRSTCFSSQQLMRLETTELLVVCFFVFIFFFGETKWLHKRDLEEMLCYFLKKCEKGLKESRSVVMDFEIRLYTYIRHICLTYLKMYITFIYKNIFTHTYMAPKWPLFLFIKNLFFGDLENRDYSGSLGHIYIYTSIWCIYIYWVLESRNLNSSRV